MLGRIFKIISEALDQTIGNVSDPVVRNSGNLSLKKGGHQFDCVGVIALQWVAFFILKRLVKFIDDELEQSMDEIGCPVDFTPSAVDKVGRKHAHWSGLE